MDPIFFNKIRSCLHRRVPADTNTYWYSRRIPDAWGIHEGEGAYSDILILVDQGMTPASADAVMEAVQEAFRKLIHELDNTKLYVTTWGKDGIGELKRCQRRYVRDTVAALPLGGESPTALVPLMEYLHSKHPRRGQYLILTDGAFLATAEQRYNLPRIPKKTMLLFGLNSPQDAVKQMEGRLQYNTAESLRINPEAAKPKVLPTTEQEIQQDE